MSPELTLCAVSFEAEGSNSFCLFCFQLSVLLGFLAELTSPREYLGAVLMFFQVSVADLKSIILPRQTLICCRR